MMTFNPERENVAVGPKSDPAHTNIGEWEIVAWSGEKPSVQLSWTEGGPDRQLIFVELYLRGDDFDDGQVREFRSQTELNGFAESLRRGEIPSTVFQSMGLGNDEVKRTLIGDWIRDTGG